MWGEATNCLLFMRVVRACVCVRSVIHHIILFSFNFVSILGRFFFSYPYYCFVFSVVVAHFIIVIDNRRSYVYVYQCILIHTSNLMRVNFVISVILIVGLMFDDGNAVDVNGICMLRSSCSSFVYASNCVYAIQSECF